MENLSTVTSQLKELLHDLVDERDKEEMIFQHISRAEKTNCCLEDFPSDLDWFNTSEPLTGFHLQGKIAVLDFFTYCCINCLHIIPHLRQLEENFSVADGLIVIGVHSAKFENEKDSENILLALQRYSITHPVVNDKDCTMWNKLAISCWPTIVILSPDRKPLFSLVGEGHREELMLYVKTTLKFYKKSLSSHQLPVVTCDQIITSSILKFPGKISRWKDIFAVSDSGHHRIIIFDGNGYIKFKIGGKTPGFKDGSFETSRFNSPQGLTFFDSDNIYVADTENHAIRLINLRTLSVTTVVGNGLQGLDYKGGKLGRLQEICSPWDVCVVPSSDVELPLTPPQPFTPPPLPPPPPLQSPSSPSPPPPPPPPPPHPPLSLPPNSPPLPPPPPSLLPPTTHNPTKTNSAKVVLIAAAGTHQIWAYFVEKCLWWRGQSYEEKVCVAIAGSGKEENRNNRYPLMASFAQPSGLAYSKELKSVLIADSESSSIRRLSLEDGSVSHVVGGARSPNDLFSYGDADGKGYEVKLQHPLGVIWSSKEKSLFLCDTYNHKVKKVCVNSRSCSSLHDSGVFFSEPSGGCLSEAEDLLYVCDTNNNCVKTISLASNRVEKLEIKEKSQTVVDTPAKDVWEAETSHSKAGGTLSLKIEFFPKEIHGNWRTETDGAKVEGGNAKGKVTTNVVEIVFSFLPSDVDDVLQVFFDLVLCGEETCSFKKFSLRLSVRRREAAKGAGVCELKKNIFD